MVRTAFKRASFTQAVKWIAFNDEPGEKDEQQIADSVTVMLIADIFGRPAQEVGRRVLRERIADEKREANRSY